MPNCHDLRPGVVQIHGGDGGGVALANHPVAVSPITFSAIRSLVAASPIRAATPRTPRHCYHRCSRCSSHAHALAAVSTEACSEEEDGHNRAGDPKITCSGSRHCTRTPSPLHHHGDLVRSETPSPDLVGYSLGSERVAIFGGGDHKGRRRWRRGAGGGGVRGVGCDDDRESSFGTP